jgi:hypothetical protein
MAGPFTINAKFNIPAKDRAFDRKRQSNLVMHQMIVMAAQLVGILLFSGIKTNVVIVALKGGHYVGDLWFIDP